MSEVSAFFRFCPACGKRFHIRVIGKELTKESEERVVERTRERLGGRWGPGSPGWSLDPLVVEADVPAVVKVEDFRYTYKCAHCGHVWSEVREKKSEREARP